MQFYMVAGWLAALFVSVQRRWSEAGQREDPQGAPDDGALRPGPPGSSGSTQDTHWCTFESHIQQLSIHICIQTIFTVYLLYCWWLYINQSKKKKQPLMKPKWTHMWQMLQMWPVLPAWLVCHLIKRLCDLLLESCLRLARQRCPCVSDCDCWGGGGSYLYTHHTHLHTTDKSVCWKCK